MKKRLVIIDGHAIIHRAYHAIPPMNVKDGTMVNAAYGFTSMLLKVMEDIKPTHLAVSFDVAGGTFRDEVYEDYKATRVAADQDLYDQIPLCYEIVEAFDIPIFEQEGFEADDVIGTIAKKQKAKINGEDMEIIIVTGDKDMLQLVDDEIVKVYLLRKGFSQYEMFGAKEVTEYFGFGPERVTDYKALCGDSSDNIPGVRGIGDKGAKQLIEAAGSIEDIYKNIKKLEELGIRSSVVKKLEEGKEDARMSKELATIRTNVTGLGFKLKDTETHTFDLAEVESLFKKFEFFSLLKRIPGAEKTADTKQRTAGRKKVKVVSVEDADGVKAMVADMKKEKQVACREVLSGKDVMTSSLLGFVFVTYENAYYVELAKLKKKEQETVLGVFANEKITLIGHDLKQLLKALVRSQSTVVRCPLFDIMIASYIVNSSTRAHDLKSIVMRELGEDLPAASDQGSLFGIDPSIAAQELQMVLSLHSDFKDKLGDVDNEGLFEKVEMALIPVLAEMELNGIAIDEKKLGEMSKTVTADIEKLKKKVWKEAGEEFNVASSVQLREVLYEKMELPTEGIKKGKTGYSTAASELEKLREYSPIIEFIEDFRELEKLRNTYIDVLPTLVNKETKRIHTSFNQAVASTGRLSSSDPNLQNIPIRTEQGKEIRNAFVAEKGNVLLAADYSQIELRIVASLAEDEELLGIFERGEDVHTATAAVINGVKLEEVTKEMRRAAKAVNFGVLYGMGAFGLARGTGLTQWEAKEFIEKYFESFAGVKAYMDGTLEEAKRVGYVETLFGRRRYVPELSSSNYQVRSSGERMAINMPVQGTAADLMKMAMIAVWERIGSHEWSTNDTNAVRLLLQVHDELVLEVKKGLEKEVSQLVKETMEGVAELRVPIDVEVHTGTRWGELK